MTGGVPKNLIESRLQKRLQCDRLPPLPHSLPVPAMEVNEVPTGFLNKPVKRKHLLLFLVSTVLVTIAIVLLFLTNPSWVERVLGVITQGGSATTLSKILDKDFNLSVGGDVEGDVLRSTSTDSPPLVVASTELAKNLNADLLDNHHGTYYLDASNLNAGTVDLDFLPDLSSLYLSINGTAVNSSKLGGQSYLYYLDASNLNAGTVDESLLPDLSSTYLTVGGTAANALELAGEDQSFYLNASNLNAGTVDESLLPDLSSLYLSLSGGTLSGILDLGDYSIDSLGYVTFSDGAIQSTAQATPATFVVCADDSQNTGRCDYVADGTADNVEIQEAIDDLPSTGGKVVLLEGNYYVATPVDLRSNLEISGMQGTKLHLTVRTNFFRWDENSVGVHQTDPYTTVPLHDIYIHDMELDGNKVAFSSPSAFDADKGRASAVKIFNSSRLHFANLYIHDMEASYAILLKGRVYPGFDSGSTDVFVQKNIFRNIGDAALNNGAVYSDHDNTIIQDNLVDTINGNGLDIDVAQEGIISDNVIKNVTSTGDQGYSIVTGYNADNIVISGNTISGASRGIANHIGGSTASDNHIIVNNLLQDSPNAKDSAIKLLDSGHVVKGNRIRNWGDPTPVTGIGNIGINLSGTTNSIISGNVISGVTTRFGIGINLSTGVGNLVIENNVIFDTGIVGEKGWGLRILASGDITGITIRGNRIFDSGAGVQDYGIFLQGVTATSKVQIEGNYLEGNVSAAIGSSSSLSSTVKAIRNRGFTTESSGTATVASGSTSIAVSHGLGVTPSAKDIQVTPTNDLGSAAKFWISSVGASTFTINVDIDPGASTATFSWSALIL